ncbi:MAG: hypothetical protein WC477_06995 [Patescibacteria group bacterium]
MSSTRSVQQILASVVDPSKPAVKPAATPATKLVVPTLFHRQCVCKRKFVTANPKHDKCSRCAGKLRRARTQQLVAGKQRDELRECLREAFVAGALPASARVTRNNSQVVVVWQGRSHTFYAPSQKAA